MNKEEVLDHAMSLGFGGMNRHELGFLYDYCKDKNVLELGSHVGQSSYVIASVAKYLTCVDAWIDGAPYLEEKQSSIYGRQEKGMKQQFDFNLRGFTNLRKLAFFTDAALHYLKDDYDIVLIDADHSYEVCKRDIELYKSKAPIIIFHDYNTPSWPGVKQAVDESGLEPIGEVHYLKIVKGNI